MRLPVEMLTTATNLGQYFTVGSANRNVTYIRPHLLKYGSPTGTLTLQVRDSSGSRIIAQSTTIAMSSIVGNPNFHGYVRFDISANLKASTQYFAYLVSGSYTSSESNYIGWVLDNEFKKYPASFGGGAFDMEIWGRKAIQRGIY